MLHAHDKCRNVDVRGQLARGTEVYYQSLPNRKGCTNLQMVYEQGTIFFILSMKSAEGSLGIPSSGVNSEGKENDMLLYYTLVHQF